MRIHMDAASLLFAAGGPAAAVGSLRDDPLLEDIRHGAREFGIWLSREFDARCPGRADGVQNHDYLDDSRGRALRYRFIVDARHRAFLRGMTPEIAAKGWHLTVETQRGRNRWQLIYEPLLTAVVPRAGVFWHVTPQRNVDSVLAQGLQPRGSRHGFRYPQPRIYLIRQEKDAARMAGSLAMRDDDKETYCLLRVDLRRAKGVKLHIDPELRDVAVYTTQPVPAGAVSLASDTVA